MIPSIALNYRFAASIAIFSITACTGCFSGRVPVAGTVKYPDGSPLDAGTVIAEALIEEKNVTVQANVESDGSFKLGGVTAGDGAFPGKYRAVVMPVALGDAELGAGKVPSVDGKFTRFESSGIEFEVTQGPNVVDITVTKPKSK